MKRIDTASIAALVAAFLAILALGSSAAPSWVFSADGTNVVGSPRPCPVQGVSLSTGRVVVGLNALGAAEQVDCGYWPLTIPPKPAQVSNEQYRAGGYLLERAALRAVQRWTPYVPKPRPIEYSKRKLYRAFAGLGVWERVKAYMQQAGVLEDWEYATTLESTDPLMTAAVEAVRAMLGYTPAQMQEVLDQCVAD